MKSNEELSGIASQIRRDILRMVTAAGSGHPGGSLSSADIVTALFFEEMKHDPASWTRDAADQDVFILSAGHLAPVYYAALARSGYFPIGKLGTLRRFGGLQGHPSVGIKGVFQPSGSLGQGLACAAGIAYSKKMDGASERVFALLGDGECEEGEIWETAMWAPHKGLDNLIAIVDWNGKQIDGPIDSITGIEDLSEKWSAFGWDVIIADGHDFDSIRSAFGLAARRNGRPKAILARTVMGRGVAFMEGSHEWHGKVPSEEQCASALEALEETLGDF